MLQTNTNTGCLDYVKKNDPTNIIPDVLPLFQVSTVIKSIETPQSTPWWKIDVDNRGHEQYQFLISSECTTNNQIRKDLIEHGILSDPWLENPIISHLIYGHNCCIQNGFVEYRNEVLGWHEFENVHYYLFDQTLLMNRILLKTC